MSFLKDKGARIQKLNALLYTLIVFGISFALWNIWPIYSHMAKLSSEKLRLKS